MISGVLRSIIAGIFFTSYFDIVDRYELYQTNADKAIVNPISDVREFNSKGMQAIHYAVEKGNFGAIMTLIEKHGANINEKTKPVEEGQGPIGIPAYSTPFIIAIIKNNLEIFHYLLSKSDLDKNLGTDQFKTPLHFAAEIGNLEMVESLIAHKAKISYLKGTRKTAFHLALASCNVEVADWLAERSLGLGPVCRDKNNQLESIFHYLARQKLPTEIWIKMLRICEKTTETSGAVRFIDRRALSGLTPLQVAIEEENDAAIAGLILSGADLSPVTFKPSNVRRSDLIKTVYEFFNVSPITPEFFNEEKETIWHLCVRFDAVHLIQALVFLFPEKQNIRSYNLNGVTPLDLAFEMHNFNAALELIKLHDHVIQIEVLERLVSSATWNCWPELLEALIQEFPTDFAYLMSSSSPLSLLHIVATASVRTSSEINPKTITLLLIKNYPNTINLHDKLGRTALHLALECDFKEFFEWLAEAKLNNSQLDFNVKDDKGNSFFDLLKEKEEKRILKLLDWSPPNPKQANGLGPGTSKLMTVELLQTFNDTIEPLWTCAWSSNGKLLGVSGADKTIRIYSLSKTGTCYGLTNELKGAHTKSIRSISFCPRRARLAAASFDGTVSIWTGSGSINDVSSLKWSCTATLEGHENEVKSCGWGVFLNDQAEEEQVFLSTCGRDKTVWIWAMEEAIDGQDEDFECLAVIQEHEQDIKCLAWHPTRPLFLTGSYDESVMAWGPLNSSLDDWIAVGKIAKDLEATVWTVSFAPDGKKLAVGLSNGKIILYNLTEGWKSFDEWTRNVVEIFAPIPIEEEKAFSGCDDGEGCCSSGGNSNKGGCCSSDQPADKSGCCSTDEPADKSGCFSNDQPADNHETKDSCCGSNSAPSDSESEEESGCCGGSGGGKSKKMQIDSCCSSKKPRTSPTLSIPPAEIYSIAWNSSSAMIALACSDHSVRVVDVVRGAVVEVVEDAHEGEVNCVAWSPSENDILASVGDDGRLRIWKIQ